MWSFVGSKAQQRWLWHAIDHLTGVVLAYVLGSRAEEVLVKLQKLLNPCGLVHFSTAAAGVSDRHLPAPVQTVGKISTQQIERKHLRPAYADQAAGPKTNLFLEIGLHARHGDWSVCESL